MHTEGFGSERPQETEADRLLKAALDEQCRLDAELAE